MASARKIMLVDDDPAIVDFLSLCLRYEGYEVTSAGTGMEALKLSKNAEFDVVVLDWILPDIPGPDICQELRRCGDTAIIMLTARDDVPDRVQGLRSGADDYLVKPFHFEELLARIEATLRRRGIEPRPDMVTFLSLSINKNTFEVTRGHKKVILTPTEFKLLLLFAENPRQVFSKDNILDRVWGYDYMGDTNIVEVYIGYLRKKLGRPPLIHTIRGLGYVLDSPARHY